MMKKPSLALLLLLLLLLLHVHSSASRSANTTTSAADETTTNSTSSSSSSSSFTIPGTGGYNETDVRERQEAARRRRRDRERRRAGFEAVQRTLEAGKTENCRWQSDPLAFMKGELCGSHYKILGIERNKGTLPIEKAKVKKAFRQVSLSLHPDKNPVEDADTAFNLAQTAYECLIDESCLREYDQKLEDEEQKIAMVCFG
jgi:hypothetical protein